MTNAWNFSIFFIQKKKKIKHTTFTNMKHTHNTNTNTYTYKMSFGFICVQNDCWPGKKNTATWILKQKLSNIKLKLWMGTFKSRKNKLTTTYSLVSTGCQNINSRLELLASVSRGLSLIFIKYSNPARNLRIKLAYTGKLSPPPNKKSASLSIEGRLAGMHFMTTRSYFIIKLNWYFYYEKKGKK